MLRNRRGGTPARSLEPRPWAKAGISVCLCVSLVLCSGGPSHGVSGSQEIEADLEGDGRCEKLVLSEESPDSLTIWRDGEKIWQGIPRKWRPWKLLVADVDGDGVKEIIVGVHKTTRFWPEPHNCLFVFGWDGRKAFPKWLGSRLSKPFVDFAFAELDGEAGEELASLEVTQNGGRCLVVYSWCGFGFVGDWQSQDFAYAALSRSSAGEIILALPNGEHFVLERKDNSYNLANVQVNPSRATGGSKDE